MTIDEIIEKYQFELDFIENEIELYTKMKSYLEEECRYAAANQVQQIINRLGSLREAISD